MWMPAQSSRSAHALLYLAAVRTSGVSIETVGIASAWALVVAEELSGERTLVLAGLVTGEPVQLLFYGQQRKQQY